MLVSIQKSAVASMGVDEALRIVNHTSTTPPVGSTAGAAEAFNPPT